jgi:uncharacterized membrane protein YcaP (DUF421 family)
MWLPDNAGELFVRAAAVYFGLLLLLRLSGKRTLGQIGPLDFLIMLIVSEAVQNALVGDDKTLGGAAVVVLTLIGLNLAVGFGMVWSKRLARLFDGTPAVLVRHGRIDRDVLRSEMMTLSELREALRQKGIANVGRVRFAVLERDGSVTVATRDRDAPDQ